MQPARENKNISHVAQPESFQKLIVLVQTPAIGYADMRDGVPVAYRCTVYV